MENNEEFEINENRKKRVMLRVAYDGTKFHGWQKAEGQRTVEGVLNETLSELLKEEITVIGASRTDAGVHSLGSVAVFDTTARIPAEKVSFALNTKLPHDVSIQESKEVPLDFHPRHCDSKKTYEYKILNRQFAVPTERYYAYHYYRPLDVNKMTEAAKLLEGEHDFTSFCSVNTQSENHVRTIYCCNVTKDGDMIKIRVTGSGFLYNMVRIIAGTLIDVGLGVKEPSEITDILEAKDRRRAGATAPAVGLMMIETEFL